MTIHVFFLTISIQKRQQSHKNILKEEEIEKSFNQMKEKVLPYYRII